MDKINSRELTLGAIITVLSLLILLLTSILVTSKVFLVCLASFLISILIIETKVNTAVISYVSTVILSVILVPNKLIVAPYVLFFGYYGITKYYIEKINKLSIEYILKLLNFNIYVFLNYKLLTVFIKDNIKLPLTTGIIIIGLQVFFLVYDYVFSLFISYYRQKIQRHLKR